MNEALFDLMNGHGHTHLLDAAGRFWAQQGIIVLAAALGLLGLREIWRDWRRATAIAVAAAGALAVTGLLLLVAGHLVVEPRPFVGDHDTVLLIHHAADNSFPSDHSAVAAAMAGVGLLAWRRWAPLLALLVAAIGLARIFVGVHLPGDVLAGWIGGGAAAALAWVGVYRLQVAERLPVRRWRGSQT